MCLPPGHGYQAGGSSIRKWQENPPESLTLKRENYERTSFRCLCHAERWRGQSTLTALTASYLYYLEGVDVIVIDCDDRQHSQKDYRENDLNVTGENPYLKRVMQNFYRNFGKKAYEIILSNPAEAAKVAVERLDEGANPQVVFFDITGTVNDIEIVKLLSVMDYLFVPITTDTADMKSSIRFASHVVNNMITTGKTKIKDVNLVWNRVPSKAKTRLCGIIDNYLDELGLHSLDTVLANSSRFFKDGAAVGKVGMFRSTMLPPDKRLLKGSNLPELVAEIRKIINV